MVACFILLMLGLIDLTMEKGTIFFIIWMLFAFLIITTLYRKGKRALAIFPDINTVPIMYRDKFASGHSMKSTITKLGGARNALDIVVTDKELWLKSMVIFAGIGQHYDLLHRIPLDAITNISSVSCLSNNGYG